MGKSLTHSPAVCDLLRTADCPSRSGAGEDAGGLRADGEDGIGQHGRESGGQLAGGKVFQAGNGGDAEDGILRLELVAGLGDGGGAQEVSQGEEGAGSGEGGGFGITGGGEQEVFGIGLVVAEGMEGPGMTEFSGSVGAFHIAYFLGRPGGVLVVVATVAGVGNTEFHGEVGTGYAYAVVATGIDDHVGFLGHMALNALGALGALLVEVVGGGVVECRFVGLGGVTAHAKLVALDIGAGGVGIVAVGTLHLIVVHLALDEGTVDIDLVVDLAVEEPSHEMVL